MAKKPCAVQCPECPFRHSSLPTYLGDYTAQSVCNSLWRNIPFFCHPKINYSDPKWMEKADKNGRLCLGSLKFANDIMAPKRLGAYPGEEDAEVIVARALVESNQSVDVMPVREFMRWHDPANSTENIKALPARLKQYPRKPI
jgi:hypothetical protein